MMLQELQLPWRDLREKGYKFLVTLCHNSVHVGDMQSNNYYHNNMLCQQFNKA